MQPVAATAFASRLSRCVIVAVAMVAAGCNSGHPVPRTSSATTEVRTTTSVSAPPTLRLQNTTWVLPTPRSRASAVAVGQRILVLGGLEGSASTAEVLAIDPVAGTVSPVGNLPAAVHDAAAAPTGAGAVVIGGGDAQSTDLVQTWSPGTAQIAGRLPSARSDLAAVETGGRVFVLGGYDGSRMATAVLAGPVPAGPFSVIGSLIHGVRYPAVAAIGESIWIIGGQTQSAETPGGEVDLIQRFDVASGTTTVVGHLPAPISHASAFVLGGALYVAGGRTAGVARDEVWRIEVSGSTTLVARLPSARSDAAVVADGSTAWLIGGEGAQNQLLAGTVEAKLG